MKTKPSIKYRILFTSLIFGLCFMSCNKTSKSETETNVGDYKTPESIPLKFTDPEPFEWETITSEALTTPVTYALDVDELPSEPFELNHFKPLKEPMQEYDLDWDNLPSEKLKLDSVSFTVTQSAIKKPSVTKMRPPSIMKGTNANLLQLSTSEGLPTNEITAMLETEQGDLWIASSAAAPLTLYDGENAFTYDYQRIFSMTFDKQGRLWITTVLNSFYVLDFKNNIEYMITPSLEQFLGVDILCDHTGTIYLVSYQNGIYRMDADMKNLQKLDFAAQQLAFMVFEDSQNNIWISTDDGISILDKERASLKKMSGNADYNFIAFHYDITEDKTGNVWITAIFPPSTANTPTFKVLKISLKNQKIAVLSAKNGYNIQGHRIEEDNHGNFWIAGSNEIYILSKDNKSSKTIGLNSTLTGTNKRARSLRRKEGSLWFATVDKGIVIANDFTLNTEYFDASRGLIDNEFWDIEEDSRGELWLGTSAGINIIDPKHNTIKSLTHEQLHRKVTNTVLYVKEISKDKYFLHAGAGFSIYDRKNNTLTQYASDANMPINITGFAELDAHNFWLYSSQGMFLYDIENNSLKKLTSKTDPNILNAVNQALITYDGKGILWVPTQTNGLAKVDVKNSSISYLTIDEGLCDNRVNVATISEEGDLWVATMNGVAVLNLEQNTLINLKEENGLIPTEVYDLIERDTIIYVASVNGLMPIEKSAIKNTNNGFYNFNKGFGFKSNDYLEGSGKFLKNGQFWSGVTNPSNEWKLLVMNTAPKLVNTLSTVHINNMFVMDENLDFDYKSSNDSINKSTSVYTNAKNIKWDSVKRPYNIPKGLVLPFDQNSLSFSYSSGDAFNRDQLTYRFILDGEDDDWTYASNKTKTKNYYNLKPGEYAFKVASKSFNRQWSAPDVLPFKISPPWWQTWWAYVIFGLIVASVLRLYILFRARKLRRENKFLEEKVKERTNELEASIEDLKATQSQLIQSEKMASLGELTAGIAHEIQNPLNFVNNFSEVNIELIDEMQEELKAGNLDDVIEISNDIKDNQKKINHHGKRADSIVKGMLKHSRNTSGEKEPTNINAIADEYLRLAYHGLRAKDKTFNATLNTDFDESIGKINVVAQDMGRVVLNLITNALHAITPNANAVETDKTPTIWVSTEQLGNQVLIKIKDNGSGIPKDILDKIFQPFFTTKVSGQGTGLGLSMSYDIVKSHGGELKVESKEGEGTTFTIVIPK